MKSKRLRASCLLVGYCLKMQYYLLKSILVMLRITLSRRHLICIARKDKHKNFVYLPNIMWEVIVSSRTCEDIDGNFLGNLSISTYCEQ